jgi:class 3 adenylate cyclase
MDVGVWLRSLGLSHYEVAFSDNSVDADILADLSDSDLEELGVTLGDRKRLLKAIANLGAALTLPRSTGAPPALLQRDAAERRQLTVMVCDLVGSTRLTARLDPEDTREVVRAYQDACSGAIARYDGFVAKFMGDGVLAYFGFPRAHEDDAERAVRAGLDVAAVVPKLDTRANESLKVRIGIATGIVVVGDLIGPGSAQEQAVVGQTPNLAARLQALAEPGSVVIAESSRRLLGRMRGHSYAFACQVALRKRLTVDRLPTIMNCAANAGRPRANFRTNGTAQTCDSLFWNSYVGCSPTALASRPIIPGVLSFRANRLLGRSHQAFAEGAWT